jgi:hypothetical protein
VVILHAFIALLAGFLTMTVIVVAATAVIAYLVPGWVGDPTHPSGSYIFVNLGYSFLAAAAGGYVAAWLGRTTPLAHTIVLAVVVLLISALNALLSRGKQAIAYQIALVVLSPIGIVAGGLVRLRSLGIL